MLLLNEWLGFGRIPTLGNLSTAIISTDSNYVFSRSGGVYVRVLDELLKDKVLVNEEKTHSLYCGQRAAW